MIEFIKLARKRGVMADVIHAIFNVAFASMTIFLTAAFNTPWPAILLVVLSKWRVIAVRPRYWWANFLSSLPDLTFGIGLAIISWGCGQIGEQYATVGQHLPISVLTVQITLGIIYALWLIAVKPKHSEAMVGFQALASQIVGITAIFFVSQSFPLVVTMLLTFVVAFASARQALGLYEEKDQDLLATVWGLLAMELAFVSWHWSVSYQITPLIRVPQMAIISAVVSVIAYRVYRAWQNDQAVTWDELGYPVVFTLAVTFLVLFAFSGLF